MKTSVEEAIEHIKANPSAYRSLGHWEFSGFGNGKYELMHAGNNAFVIGSCSIIKLNVNGTEVNTTFLEKRALEFLSIWWWENAPSSQIGLENA